MGSMSIWHWLIVGVVVLLLFGKGRISELMSETAKGIKAFKKGMSEDDDQADPAVPPSVAHKTPAASHSTKDAVAPDKDGAQS